MNRAYDVTFEIAGPTAMFTRPDTGAAPISYPVPTYSALKGIFEAVARKRGAYLRPRRVEICKPVVFGRYVTNYGGPLRKPKQFADRTSYQLPATVLVDVCYRVFGTAEALEPSESVNAVHALQEIFTRRLQIGQSFYTPCLGWKEFLPTYFGPLRSDTAPDPDVNLHLPSLLHSVFDQPCSGTVAPVFLRDVEVRAGVLAYDREAVNAR